MSTPVTTAPLYPVMYEGLVRAALLEDLGRAGDVTADACIPDGTQARALFQARHAGIIAGLAPALSAFSLLDPTLSVRALVADGARVDPGQVVAVVEGAARPILSGERTALNLLGRLCGIASKTTPGLRALEKYAVRVGGGGNHRFGLDDAVLIKDNHLVAAGGLRAAVERARAHVGHMVKIEVEVDTLAQLEDLLTLPVDAVLLDNMDPATLRQAVALVDGRMITEASGGITPQTVRAVAETGVTLISLGWLTHSVTNFDIGLDFESL
jgi:nicotinate-nucleotide pyrophosphorylase (carboxylating)